MDKIKNMLSGKSQDTETTNPTHSSTTGTNAGLSGEGSHFGNTRDPVADTTSHVPGAFPGTNTSSGVGNTYNNSGITSGPGATTTGPHSSNLANKADPRIDSDNSRNVGHSGVTGTGVGGTHTSGLSGTGNTTTSGPHSSNLENKVDPRIDSDNSRTLGHSGVSGTSGVGNTSHAYPAGVAGTGSTTAGPHSSNLANKADPLVDSDNSRTTGHSGLPGTSTSGHNTTGLGSTGTSGQGSHLSRDNDRNLGSNSGYPSNTGVTGSNQSFGHHLGRDAAAIGTAGAVGEGVHHHNQHQGNLGSNTGYTGSSSQGLPHHTGSNAGYAESTGQNLPHHQSGSGVTGTNQSSGRHLGRDAAAVGTAGAVGEGVHHHNQQQGNLASTTHHTGVGSGGQHVPHAGQGVTGNTQSSSHHLGRDAAAVGTAGAVGEGVHHHNQHQGNLGAGSNTGYTGSTGSYHTGPTGSAVSGPHTTATANRLDPAVNPARGVGFEDAHHHDPIHGGGAEEADRHHGGKTHGTGVGHSSGVRHSSGIGHSTTTTTTTSTGVGHSTPGHDTTSTGHHLGRDAAVAGGVGGAAYEADKHHGTSNTLDGPAPNTAGPHKQDWMNKLDPRVDAKKETDGSSPSTHGGVTGASSHTTDPTHHSSSTDHHTGRDAAVAGGVGGAAYEAGKHHHNDQSLGDPSHSSITGDTSTRTTAGPHSSNVANRADPVVDSDRSKDHHYGRDAAVAGGVGTAAYGADKHHHDKNLEKTEHKHEKELEKEAKKEHKQEVKHEKDLEKESKKEHKDSKGGLLSFLHRDKNKKYTKEEEAEFDRQEREYNNTHGKSHTGRDAALGGAAVGAGAYEADKHHHGHESSTNKPLPTAPGNHGIGTGAGTQNALAGETGHHDRHGGAVPLAEKPAGKDLGDKLHGVERNRGVAGESGFPGTEGYGAGSHTGTAGHHHTGRDAAGLGAAGALGEHEYRQHQNTTGQHSGLTGSGQHSGVTGTGHQSSLTGTTGHQSGLAGTGQHSGVTGTGHHSNLTGTDNQYGSTGHSHTGRDAAALGTLGTAGAVGEHEHRKHENTTDQHSGLTGSGHHFNTTGTGHHSNLTGTGNNNNQYGTSLQSGLTGNQSDLTGNNNNYGTSHQSGLTGTGNNNNYPFGTGNNYSTGTGTGHHSGLSEATTDQSGNPIGSSHNTSSGLGHSGDRNRLHKEPPSSHPASQYNSSSQDTKGLHVPASGAERERLVGQGEQRLDNDTGVAHGNVQPERNY